MRHIFMVASALRWEGRIASVLIQEFSFKGMDDRREQNHLTFPESMEKSFIRRLIACVALWLVLEVRWVYRDVVRMLR